MDGGCPIPGASLEQAGLLEGGKGRHWRGCRSLPTSDCGYDMAAGDVPAGELCTHGAEGQSWGDSPGVVVPGVDPDGVPETGQGFVQLFCQHKLVAQQGVGIGIVGVHLDGPLEELDGDVMLPLQAEAVSCSTPGLEEQGRSRSFYNSECPI